jgi:hypothetical protein
MAAPAGNRFWEARSSHGRKPIFASPDGLMAACSEYFEWVEQNPLWEDKIISFQGAATHVNVAKMRAMTIAGLCIFLDIARRTWDEYRGREDFLPVCEQVEQIIRDQKFTGAAADLLNANIIARDLGLSDKTELTGANGGPIETHELSETEAARRIAFTLAKATKE